MTKQHIECRLNLSITVFFIQTKGYLEFLKKNLRYLKLDGNYSLI